MSKKQRQDGDVGGDDDGGGDGVEEEGLVKYRDFDASKFSTSITLYMRLQRINWKHKCMLDNSRKGSSHLN